MMDDDAKKAADSIMTMAMCPGMTLRDWFAGQAMNSMTTKIMQHGELVGMTREFLAERAYAEADAMMAERAKEKTP